MSYCPTATEPRSPGGRESDREQYRRGGQGEGKASGAGSDFNPEFVSSYNVSKLFTIERKT